MIRELWCGHGTVQYGRVQHITLQMHAQYNKFNCVNSVLCGLDIYVHIYKYYTTPTIERLTSYHLRIDKSWKTCSQLHRCTSSFCCFFVWFEQQLMVVACVEHEPHTKCTCAYKKSTLQCIQNVLPFLIDG